MNEYPRVPAKRSPRDVIISKETQIAAPVETVFDVVTDLQLFVEFEEGVKSVTVTSEVTEGVGTTTHWVLEDQSTGENWELDEEIIYYRRPFQYAYVGHGGGKDYSGVHTLEPNPDGTTHHFFNEAFHFDVDPEVYGEVVGGMVANIRAEAERRAARGR